MIIHKNVSLCLTLLLASSFYKTHTSFVSPKTMPSAAFAKIIISACSFAGALFSWTVYTKRLLEEQANALPLLKTEKQIITFSGSEIELKSDKYGNPAFCFTQLKLSHREKEHFLECNNVD